MSGKSKRVQRQWGLIAPLTTEVTQTHVEFKFEHRISIKGSAFMLKCNDKHDIEGNPLLQYSITA